MIVAGDGGRMSAVHRPTVGWRLLAVGAILLAGLAVACGARDSAAGDGAASGPATVLAAASLTESFGELEAEFEKRFPGSQIEVSYGSSSSLATQIEHGAPADVFASADMQNMQRVHMADLVDQPRPFAANTLQIVVSAGNPKQITGLADLVKPDLVVAMAAPAVPAGRVAAETFGKAGLPIPESSQEPDVKAVLHRVVLGEADAGLVWATDVLAAGSTVQGIAIPAALGGQTTYPIAQVKAGSGGATGAAFINFILSDTGQQILQRHGFRPPCADAEQVTEGCVG
jgi:molybdate transport system substrate-binding protein